MSSVPQRRVVFGRRGRSAAGMYAKSGGARSGGVGAGTLRGICPAGVPSGTQFAPPLAFGSFQFYGAICPQAVRVLVEAQERGFNSDRSQSILFGDKQTAFPTCVLPGKAGIIKKQI